MDDLRQKLFPIFLKEADRNLHALRKFLSYEDISVATSEELETAFRAAHTLKGTANLVEAESICKISRRIEAMLEKHFSGKTLPTPVEHEALKLAVDWLTPLVSALQGNLQEPTLFVAEALQALDLAEAFPGCTPLVELLDSNTENRYPRLDDPFSDDPTLQTDEDAILQDEQDPFAEDPAFGMGIDLASQEESGSKEDVSQDEPVNDDPFGEDEDFSSAEVETTVAVDSVNQNDSGELPYDPFADDPLELEDVPAVSEQVDEESSELIETEGETSTDAVEEVVGDTEEVEELDEYAATADKVAARAEEIAESLLLPDQEAVPRKDYVCCVFSIGEKDYHLPIKQMQEITDLPQLLPLPLAPPMVSGLMNLRGQVLPVINLAVLNKHQQQEIRLQRRLVIAEHHQESLAFLVDGVPYLSEDFTGEKVDMSTFLSLYRIRGAE